jgi:TPR repeat protein
MASRSSGKDTRAFAEALKSAHIGVPQSQYDVGLMYANGIGVEQSFPKAIHWVTLAADRGLAAAQYLLATRYASGVAVEKNEYRALTWLVRAAEQGHPKAFHKLGRLVGQSRQELVLACFTQAADLGLPEAHLALGEAVAQSAGPVDIASALASYQKAADLGSPAAQYALANLLVRGVGCEPSLDEALRWYRQAAAQNHPAAQVALERMQGVRTVRSSVRPKRRPATIERRRNVERWIHAAQIGDADARFHVALMFDEGLGVPIDTQEADKWCWAAAQQGHAGAQCAVGRRLEAQGDDVALDWYRKSADQGDADALFAMGRLGLSGSAGSLDAFDGLAGYVAAAQSGHAKSLAVLGELFLGNMVSIGLSCITRAANLGDAQSQFRLAEHLYAGREQGRNAAQALKWFRGAADLGHAAAQCALAGFYLRGEVVVQDSTQALHWYQKAADQGDAMAQWNLGALFASGTQALEQDLKQAFHWCHEAANQGFVPAQATLGTLNARMNNLKAATHHWGHAAAQGDPEAQFNLAATLYSHREFDPDKSNAFKWFCHAAEQGVIKAQSKLGFMFAAGDGVVEDPIEAHKWFYIADQRGDKPAGLNLERSRALLGVRQVGEAERRAASWLSAFKTKMLN